VGVFEGHSNSVNTLSFTSDERLLATGSTDGTVRVWSFPDGHCQHKFDKQVNAVCAPDGTRIATVSVKSQVVIWDAVSGQQIKAIPAFDKRTTALAFSADGRTILVGGTGPIRRVSAADGTPLGEMSGHKIIVACLRISPDGKRLASTGADGYLRLWSTRDWSETVAVKLPGSGVLQLAFTPKGDAVAVALDHRIQTYAVKDGSLVDNIDVPVKGVYGISFSPDGKYLANAAADGKVRVWKR
jgi:WD40 repeat protein